MSEDDLYNVAEETVKNNLTVLLVYLIHIMEGANGKQLIEELTQMFGVVLSSGTVYPKLHDLKEEGVLEVHEHIRTKEYRIKNIESAHELINDDISQHLALVGLLKKFDD